MSKILIEKLEISNSLVSMSRNEPSNRACRAIKALGRNTLGMAATGFFLLMAGAAPGADLSVLHASQSPTRLARGPGGKIYTTDPKVGSVFIYDSNLNTIGELKNLNLPLGIAVGIDGTIYGGVKAPAPSRPMPRMGIS